MNTKSIQQRKVRQWIMLVPSLVVIALGWKYPLLGFWVLVVMTVGIVGGMLKGRWVCGNLCPRGCLFDRMVAGLSRNRPMPGIIRRFGLRWFLWPLMFGFMIWYVAQAPTEVNQWGRAMWIMCAATTLIGGVFGLLYNPRMWCVICPIGNLAYATGGTKCALVVDDGKCRNCTTCEKKCPMQVPVTEYRENVAIVDSRCIQCGVCSDYCPHSAIGCKNKEKERMAS